jgi:hypothetical protein
MTARMGLLVVVLGLLFFGCQQKKFSDNTLKKGMIKVLVYYPRGEGKTFDIDY